MMAPFVLAGLLALAGASNALPSSSLPSQLSSPSPSSPSSSATPHHRDGACTNFDLSISVSANNSIYDIARVNNDIDVIDFVWDVERWTAPESRIDALYLVEDTFTINAQLCVPKNTGKILQIASHGFGFEKTYWDCEIQPSQYSYVDAALKAGYSMLTYDRLGVGKSSKPDGHNVVQGPVEVEILKEITVLAREGKLAQFIASDEKLFVPDFEKIVLVGHSMGSAFTIGALAEYGDIADGAVATGMIPQGKLALTGQSAYGLVYAASNDPVRFGDRGSGYLVQGAQTDANKLFFKKGFFEPELLAYGTEIKQTGTVGEFMSMGATLMKPAPGYTGPILFALAEFDLPACAGDCTGSYDLGAIKSESFPGASDVSVHIQPGSGHGLNMHTNATGHFEAIFSYLKGQGL
ncbi:alpha/beta hydrolase [Aspergillus puulaauensis]|uniref:AB hydrolase-1 domain-containing protein n=1 Tax=Aspergillus puulaauensis TaxID=1220207 RepID=A0A7R8ANN8_9EURO|nr:uncharacterized protein APUU_41536A [Aspergillus puulaauensis]BCS25092.1 hypothetical protein APUU_41536A [Aspergillus puulaauensis]